MPEKWPKVAEKARLQSATASIKIHYPALKTLKK